MEHPLVKQLYQERDVIDELLSLRSEAVYTIKEFESVIYPDLAPRLRLMKERYELAWNSPVRLLLERVVQDYYQRWPAALLAALTTLVGELSPLEWLQLIIPRLYQRNRARSLDTAAALADQADPDQAELEALIIDFLTPNR